MMKVRSPYNYDGDVVSFSTGVSFVDFPSRAQQHFRDECDINVMVQRFQRTGVPPLPPSPPGVQDFTEAHDFQSAMNLIVEARNAFASLPSGIRDRFGNDPAAYLAFVGDESNRDEAVRLGMVNAPVVEAVVESSPVEGSSD